MSNPWLQADGATRVMPTVARLAFDGHFYAVFNLIRREVVSSSEVREKYSGKNVLEWARFYGQDLLAEELEFRYPLLANQPPATTADGNDPKGTEMERLQKGVDALAKGNQYLKQQLDQVKEHVGPLDKDISGLEKKVEGKFREIEEKVEEMEDAAEQGVTDPKGFK